MMCTGTQELNDRFKGDDVDPNEEDVKRAPFRRACLVISGAEGVGVAPLIRANHITGRATLYNIAFVAQLLNRRPRIHRESLHLDASIAMQVRSFFIDMTVPKYPAAVFSGRHVLSLEAAAAAALAARRCASVDLFLSPTMYFARCNFVLLS